MSTVENKERSKLLLDGYIRLCLRQYRWINIPSEINEICLKYYYYNPEFVDLHFELEIDYRHAFEEVDIIIRCIAEIMNLPKHKVFYDGVDEFVKNQRTYWGLFRGHIPTTNHEIEHLVMIFYNSMQNRKLHQKITRYSAIGTPQLEIRELYETDQNDDMIEDEEYLAQSNQNTMGYMTHNLYSMEPYPIPEEEQQYVMAFENPQQTASNTLPNVNSVELISNYIVINIIYIIIIKIYKIYRYNLYWLI